mgnify:CR=1 FL=1
MRAPVPSSAESSSAPTADPESTVPLVEADDLSKRYGSHRAVDGVTFRIGRGELVGFLGPNGAGKSTTMRMLTGYLYPDQGHARIGGLPVDSVEARARVGYLPEHTPLYREMRVDRYLKFVATVRGVRRADVNHSVARVLRSCDLEDHATRRIGALSKGYRQRVGLAQALVADPDVLVLDEPTSGLDPGEIVRIRDLIVQLAEKKTILLSTHVLPEVEEVCQRVLILAAGRLVADGSLSELAQDESDRLSVTVDGAADIAVALLTRVDGVRSATRSGDPGEGRTRVVLQVDDRYVTADRIVRTVAEAGLTLYELRHQIPTLEHVFLSRTRGLTRVEDDA